MTQTECEPVAVSRTIASSARDIFRILSDPGSHCLIDGSAMLREYASDSVITGIGEVFVMNMNNTEMGDYEITNHVVDYEPDRRIGWKPVLSGASRAEDSEDIGIRNRHRWIYELTPSGPGITLVTEIFDCSASPAWLRKAVANGKRWVEAMTTTLERLDELCTAQETEGCQMDVTKAALLLSLEAQRAHVLGCLEGLNVEDLSRPVLPTGWNCLGLLQHLALDVERFWFPTTMAGEEVDDERDDSGSAWSVVPGTTAEEVFDLYRAEMARANAVIEATPLETPPKNWPDFFGDWRLPDLRAVMLHVITETACHAGHLDAARELIDGGTWLALG
jgi:hypothetical protein